MCLLAICMSSWEKHLFRSFAYFLIELFVFLTKGPCLPWHCSVICRCRWGVGSLRVLEWGQQGASQPSREHPAPLTWRGVGVGNPPLCCSPQDFGFVCEHSRHSDDWLLCTVCTRACFILWGQRSKMGKAPSLVTPFAASWEVENVCKKCHWLYLYRSQQYLIVFFR